MSDQNPSTEEEIVVIRLENLGAFAVPLATLRQFRVAEQDDVTPYAARTHAIVPLILAQDFVRRRTTARHTLVVDRFGAVSHSGHAQVLEVSP